MGRSCSSGWTRAHSTEREASAYLPENRSQDLKRDRAAEDLRIHKKPLKTRGFLCRSCDRTLGFVVSVRHGWLVVGGPDAIAEIEGPPD